MKKRRFIFISIVLIIGLIFIENKYFNNSVKENSEEIIKVSDETIIAEEEPDENKN